MPSRWVPFAGRHHRPKVKSLNMSCTARLLELSRTEKIMDGFDGTKLSISLPQHNYLLIYSKTAAYCWYLLANLVMNLTNPPES